MFSTIERERARRELACMYSNVHVISTHSLIAFHSELVESSGQCEWELVSVVDNTQKMKYTIEHKLQPTSESEMTRMERQELEAERDRARAEKQAAEGRVREMEGRVREMEGERNRAREEKGAAEYRVREMEDIVGQMEGAMEDERDRVREMEGRMREMEGERDRAREEKGAARQYRVRDTLTQTEI